MVTADKFSVCDGAVTDVNTDVVRFNGPQERAPCGSCASVRDSCDSRVLGVWV
jgi:hypothetical protein